MSDVRIDLMTANAIMGRMGNVIDTDNNGYLNVGDEYLVYDANTGEQKRYFYLESDFFDSGLSEPEYLAKILSRHSMKNVHYAGLNESNPTGRVYLVSSVFAKPATIEHVFGLGRYLEDGSAEDMLDQVTDISFDYDPPTSSDNVIPDYLPCKTSGFRNRKILKTCSDYFFLSSTQLIRAERIARNSTDIILFSRIGIDLMFSDNTLDAISLTDHIEYVEDAKRDLRVYERRYDSYQREIEENSPN